MEHQGHGRRVAVAVSCGFLLALGVAINFLRAGTAGSGGLTQTGVGKTTELLYIDSQGESQHVMTTPGLVQQLAMAHARERDAGASLDGVLGQIPGKAGLKVKSSGERALEEAIKDHEMRQKASEHLMRLAHKKKKVWTDKKWDKDFIHAMPTEGGTKLESASAWYSNIISPPRVSLAARHTNRHEIEQEGTTSDSSNVFHGL